MDKEADGKVSEKEWNEWLRETHTAKGAKDKHKGDTWLSQLISTLEKNMVVEVAEAKKKEEAKVAAQKKAADDAKKKAADDAKKKTAAAAQPGL